VVDGPDHYHAAMVFQHGGSAESYRRARELALRAADLGHRPARWLAAAALDRLLVHEGRRQRYGTQYRTWGGERMLVEVDPSTTDRERAEWDVPPLAEARARAVGTLPPDPTPPVVVDGVEVRIYRMGPAPGRVPPASGLPAPEPLADVPGPRPWLPDGVRLLRAGDGITAVASSGAWSVTWVSRPMSEEEPVTIGWTDDQGTPRTEVIDLGGVPAALVESDATDVRWLVRRAGPERGRMVIGSLPREDLLRVAASLGRGRPASQHSYLTSMQLGALLRRLWPGRAGRSASEQTRYDEASRLEETTQSHYRSVTESDARGRSTNDAGPPPVSSRKRP